MSISEERMEVAERLRGTRRESCLPGGDELGSVLAELVDPTCCLVEDDDGVAWCSICAGDVPEGARYCPSCGCRVVSE